jgi:hypothetical protein
MSSPFPQLGERHVNLDQIRLAMGLGYGLQDGGIRYQRN